MRKRFFHAALGALIVPLGSAPASAWADDARAEALSRESREQEQQQTQEAKHATHPAVLIESGSDKGDRAFVDSALKGARDAAKDYGIQYTEHKEYSLSNDNERIQLIKSVIKEGATDVIAVGFQNVVPVLKLAEAYPKVRFTVIDGIVPPLFTNVQSIIFKDHEGAFLVGMIAAMTTKTNMVGFVGGMDVPLIRNFAYGYVQGAKYVKPNITVVSEMIGAGKDAWNNPTRAATLANKQFDNGTDVIFAAAGGSGLGVLSAAAERKKFAIGVDSNQNGLFPGFVLTSMVKRVDKAIYDAMESITVGSWQPGIKYLGVKENALDFAVDANNKDLLTRDMIQKVEATKDLIVRGVVNVEVYTPN